MFGGAGLILTGIIAGIGMLSPFTAVMALTTCTLLLAIPFVPHKSRSSTFMSAAAISLIAVTIIHSSLASNGLLNSGAYVICVLPIAASVFLGQRSAFIFLIVSVLFALICVGKFHLYPSGEEQSLQFGQIYSKAAAYLIATLGAYASAMMFTTKTQNALNRLREAERDASHAAEAARSAQVKAERAAEAKTMFLANMSHEIRTPLNGVIGMAQILESKGVSDEQTEMVTAILESGQMLRAIVDDVLDLSKIDSDKVELVNRDADFHETLGYISRIFETAAEEKRLRLNLTMAPNLPRWLNFDTLRVRQCLTNLVSNAVKFTDTGSVSIHASANGDDDRGYIISVRIDDTGIGVPPDQLNILFEAFCQADSSLTRRFGGTGLGLTITRKLARVMGGDVTVSSAPGSGSTFTLEFRAAPAHQKDREPFTKELIDSGLLADVRILVADDTAVNRAVLRHILTPHGALIKEVNDGIEVLNLLETEQFDLLLLDAHMPRLDGIQTIKKIRATDKPWHNLKVLAITADALSGDRENYLAMGMDGYIAKPIEARPFLREVISILKDTRQNQTGERSKV
jgi:signal transduction histidine kinase/ActR/RegA family two-component response regulator